MRKKGGKSFKLIRKSLAFGLNVVFRADKLYSHVISLKPSAI